MGLIYQLLFGLGCVELRKNYDNDKADKTITRLGAINPRLPRIYEASKRSRFDILTHAFTSPVLLVSDRIHSLLVNTLFLCLNIRYMCTGMYMTDLCYLF